jgi:toxin ParE1/3/4
MRVLIGESAYADLDRIFDWIAKDRPLVAAAVINRILDSIERLGRFPHMGHAGKVADTYEWVVRGLPYIVVYQIDVEENELSVVAVFHGAEER